MTKATIECKLTNGKHYIWHTGGEHEITLNNAFDMQLLIVEMERALDRLKRYNLKEYYKP